MSSSSHSNPAAEPDTLPSAPSSTRVLRQFRVVFNAVKTHFRQVEREAGVGGASCGRCPSSIAGQASA